MYFRRTEIVEMFSLNRAAAYRLLDTSDGAVG
jgi:hypothetical protein